MMRKKIPIGSLIMAATFAVAPAFPQVTKDRIAPENANEARLNREQPPDKVMDIIGAAPGMTISEIGPGRGRYIVHLAGRVGPTGKIYAEDIDEAALRHCAERCRRNGFDNVETILGGSTDPKLPADALDLIFVISSYHHFEDPVALMKKARPALKPTGSLAIAEWVRLPDGRGGGTAPETMKTQMEEAGFVLERIDKTFEHNRMYVYLFRSRPVDRPPVLKGPYLGQKPPGMTPEQFGTCSIDRGERIFAITFSPDGGECFYTKSLKTNAIMTTREINGPWLEPKVAEFSGKVFDFEPHITTDGNRMIFGSTRDLPGAAGKKGLHQWFIERTVSGWSEPQPLGPPFENRFCMFVSVSENGNVYYTGEDGIYISKFSEGRYAAPARLPDVINRLQCAAHPFIAPDESYLLFDAQPQEGNTELLISFRNSDGEWAVCQKLDSRFNTDWNDMCAFMTRDGKLLFFSRLTEGKGDIWRISARVIEEMRAKSLLGDRKMEDQE